MGVRLQSALGGSVELNAPSTASNFTMTVPAGNGTVATTDQLQNFRNLLMNGEMKIAQRGTSFAADGDVNTLDRWKCWSLPTTQSTDVPAGYGFVNSIQLVSTTQTGTAFATLEQKFEDERIVAGKTLTMSFWIKGSAAGTGVVRNYSQSNTSGFGHLTFPITTSWTKISRTFTVPAIGAGTKDWCAFGIDFNFTSTAATSLGYTAAGVTAPTYVGTVNITGVQVEYGTVATEFERRPIQVELAMCQRYCYVALSDVLQNGVAALSNVVWFHVDIKQTMRVAPAVSVSGTIQISDDATADYQQTNPPIASANLVDSGGRIRIDGWSGLTQFRAYAGVSTIYNGKFTFNSEF